MKWLDRNDRSLPRLTFSPLAWLKLQYMCHAGDTEVGGFGISARGKPLYVEDFVTVMQEASLATVRFDDGAVADLFDRCIDDGLDPQQVGRIWIHTHPGSSADPSGTDEDTFARVFGGCDWSVMAIVSRTSQTYARLAFSAGPGGQLEIPVCVDWASWPDLVASHGPSLEAEAMAWQEEFETNINVIPDILRLAPSVAEAAVHDASMYSSDLPEDWNYYLEGRYDCEFAGF